MDFFEAVKQLDKKPEPEKENKFLFNGRPIKENKSNISLAPIPDGNKANGKHHLFVYGTFKRNNFRNSTLKGCDFLGEGYLDSSYKIMQNTLNMSSMTFPVLLVKNKNDEKDRRVFGEIWLVDDVAIKMLDLIENAPRMYRRVILPVRRDTNDHTVTELYRCVTYVGSEVFWKEESLYPVNQDTIGLPVYIFNPTSRKVNNVIG